MLRTMLAKEMAQDTLNMMIQSSDVRLVHSKGSNIDKKRLRTKSAMPASF